MAWSAEGYKYIYIFTITNNKIWPGYVSNSVFVLMYNPRGINYQTNKLIILDLIVI